MLTERPAVLAQLDITQQHVVHARPDIMPQLLILSLVLHALELVHNVQSVLTRLIAQSARLDTVVKLVPYVQRDIQVLDVLNVILAII